MAMGCSAMSTACSTRTRAPRGAERTVRDDDGPRYYHVDRTNRVFAVRLRIRQLGLLGLDQMALVPGPKGRQTRHSHQKASLGAQNYPRSHDQSKEWATLSEPRCVAEREEKRIWRRANCWRVAQGILTRNRTASAASRRTTPRSRAASRGWASRRKHSDSACWPNVGMSLVRFSWPTR